MKTSSGVWSSNLLSHQPFITSSSRFRTQDLQLVRVLVVSLLPLVLEQVICEDN